MSFKAVLFDLDGTLLNTIEDLADSMNAVLESMGFPVHKINEYKIFVGDGMSNLVRRSLPEDKRDYMMIEKCIQAMREEYKKRWDSKTRAYAGIPELMSELKLRGLYITILSNKLDDATQEVVKRFFPGVQFDAIVGARPGVPIKPDPSSALAIVEQLKLKPSEFIYVGDTGTDMQTACNAGMYAVGAVWGFRTSEELVRNGARFLISTPLSLLDFLDNKEQGLI